MPDVDKVQIFGKLQYEHKCLKKKKIITRAQLFPQYFLRSCYLLKVVCSD